MWAQVRSSGHFLKNEGDPKVALYAATGAASVSTNLILLSCHWGSARKLLHAISPCQYLITQRQGPYAHARARGGRV
jgi:hypothetical protein